MYFLKLFFFNFLSIAVKLAHCFLFLGWGEGNNIAFYLWVGAWWAVVHGVARNRTQLNDFPFTHWRRKWQPIPVFLPGES